METPFQNNSIFFVDVNKIKPNPFQPRMEFDNEQLESLSESIRMYGILQPLVVTRKEVFTEEGGMSVEYELIAGERRLRASKLAGMKEVPVVIRSQEQTDQEKLELAIIENLQREDLNPVDRAKAFRLLADDFSLKHAEIGKRVGKSREYVSNSLRLLALPENILAALTVKKVSEGHARSLLMLSDRPEEQQTLFKEILLKGLTVRHTEKIARRVAHDKVRKKTRAIDPHTVEVEDEISEALGTRVHIERKAIGGKIQIDFFSEDDLIKILDVLKQHEEELAGDEKGNPHSKMNTFIAQSGGLAAATGMMLEQAGKIAETKKTTVSEQVDEQHLLAGKITEANKDIPKEDQDVEEDLYPVEDSSNNKESGSKNKKTEEDEKEKVSSPSKFSYASLSKNPDITNKEIETEESLRVKEINKKESEEEEGKEVPTFSYASLMNNRESEEVSTQVDEDPFPETKNTGESLESFQEENKKNQADLKGENETLEDPVFNPIKQVEELATQGKDEPQEEKNNEVLATQSEQQNPVVKQPGPAHAFDTEWDKASTSQAQDPYREEVGIFGGSNMSKGSNQPLNQQTKSADDLYGYDKKPPQGQQENAEDTNLGIPHYGANDNDDLYRV